MVSEFSRSWEPTRRTCYIRVRSLPNAVSNEEGDSSSTFRYDCAVLIREELERLWKRVNVPTETLSHTLPVSNR